MSHVTFSKATADRNEVFARPQFLTWLSQHNKEVFAITNDLSKYSRSSEDSEYMSIYDITTLMYLVMLKFYL